MVSKIFHTYVVLSHIYLSIYLSQCFHIYLPQSIHICMFIYLFIFGCMQYSTRLRSRVKYIHTHTHTHTRTQTNAFTRVMTNNHVHIHFSKAQHIFRDKSTNQEGFLAFAILRSIRSQRRHYRMRMCITYFDHFHLFYLYLLLTH